MGYDVELSADGIEAIEKFKEAKDSGKGFDAIILDLTIPGGMGGEKAIKTLAGIDPDLKAIVSSGYSDDPIMSHYEDYGFTACIAKPYQVTELSKVLHKVLSGTSRI